MMLSRISKTNLGQQAWRNTGLRHNSRIISSIFPRRQVHMETFQPISDIFITLHETSGIPWLFMVPMMTLTLRSLVTLPLSIWQRKRIVKQQELRKIVQATTPILQLRLAAQTLQKKKQQGNAIAGELAMLSSPTSKASLVLTPEQIKQMAIKETRKRQKKLFKKYNVPLWKNVVLPLVQIPLWVTISMGIRNLVDRRFFEVGEQWAKDFDIDGIDLSGPLDPLPMLVPIVLGTFSLLNVEFNGKMMLNKDTNLVGIKTYTDESTTLAQSMRSIMNVSRMGCIFMMGVSSQTSILLALYWISSQFFSLVQNMILDKVWPYQR
ncbi:membrane insertase COX18 NDAI_0D04200 [Naumovozyma dairenensis CBS 421]|uniref:Uncharacterized protein n=1 Tax=Naumovozyma dairenensis (strain ATCC 10597 / BCRC 20456 / CBS 421 / NBRC 0211 / NRRL Y-12639) TaxID=1071378 RepID=G0WAC3_NAUDC|nr:hypothetical protein NDAI_0D04200 [Naumovozyma dairenensis CBS 421]CCD24734.1 hypothetical protein NDAI_0D04200 [Naumovozyma dairenensis CBS 421]